MRERRTVEANVHIHPLTPLESYRQGDQLECLVKLAQIKMSGCLTVSPADTDALLAGAQGTQTEEVTCIRQTCRERKQ